MIVSLVTCDGSTVAGGVVSCPLLSQVKVVSVLVVVATSLLPSVYLVVTMVVVTWA